MARQAKVWVLLEYIDTEVYATVFRTQKGAVDYVKRVIYGDWVQHDKNDKRTEEEMRQQQEEAARELVEEGIWQHTQYDNVTYELNEEDLL